MKNSNQRQFMKKWRKKNVRISKELRDIIHGYIMSDGYLNQHGTLTVDQGINQADFVEWLYEKLKALRTDKPISDVSRLDKRTNTTTYSKRFFTVLIGFFKMWYQPFTNDKGETKYKKRLPKSIHCFFNSTFLTLWFAGDGTKIQDFYGAKFEATAFTYDEKLLLQDLFFQKFNITVQLNKAGLSKTGTPQFTLNINSADYAKFKALITKIDLIEKCFPYKLHN